MQLMQFSRNGALNINIIHPRRAHVHRELQYSGASVRPENTIMYSAGNVDLKNRGVFYKTAPLQKSSTPSVKAIRTSAIFLLTAWVGG